MFLINSRWKSLTAAILADGETCPEVTSSCFAEFLNEGSPVRLGLLALSTCVGFKYGRNIILNLEVFPGTLLISVRPINRTSSRSLDLCSRDLPRERPHCAYPNPIRGRDY